jgi:hypothetical protein
MVFFYMHSLMNELYFRKCIFVDLFVNVSKEPLLYIIQIKFCYVFNVHDFVHFEIKVFN